VDVEFYRPVSIANEKVSDSAGLVTDGDDVVPDTREKVPDNLKIVRSIPITSDYARSRTTGSGRSRSTFNS
jgi:hypothetical protein